MARLKSPPARLGKEPSRFAQASTETERTRERDSTQPWRKWYKTARWQKLRREILARDGWTCQATGVPLVGKYPAPNSPVVDHRRPHRGSECLFWDASNLWTVSKDYHDRVKQSQERRWR